jgi:hypothetical protein
MNETERRAAWLHIAALQAGPVGTVTGKLFDVSMVDPERGIQIHLRSSAEDRWIPAQHMNAALDLGLARDAITPSQVRAAGAAASFQATYVAAILRAIAP